MERNSPLRWILVALAAFLLFQYVPKFFGNHDSPLQPLRAESSELPAQRTGELSCDLWTKTFHATLSTRGASLTKFQLLTAKYQRAGQPLDLSTTAGVELRRQLSVNLRNDAVAASKDPTWQLDFDSVDFNLLKADGRTCLFHYQDAKVALDKQISVTDSAYELSVETKVTNLDSKPHRHSLVAETAAWRLESEVSGGMFRVSPFLTHVECLQSAGKAVRLLPGDFEPADFKEPPFAATAQNPGDWYQAPGAPSVAAVSNAYFAHALIPQNSPGGAAPVCLLQIEDRWNAGQFKSKSEDPHGGSMYRARLAYPALELAPQASATYSFLSYIGPKERTALATAAGGHTRLIDLIDLGFFSVIAKVLVGFLLKVHSVIPNWGVAIIILTITARGLLFPLSIPGIKSMVKMRQLKPELDELNAKFKDDPQARGLAQMELFRKHNANPLKGCLPQLASMPVWFALYTTLQTAVELFNIRFLWFPDLSQSDPLFILPFIIGITSFLQQKQMPPQGDPAQQKMMLYMMPAMFTVFMLFLPAGLGVYMFTNGVLGILQFQLVDRHTRRVLASHSPATTALSATATSSTEPDASRRSSAKGKA